MISEAEGAASESRCRGPANRTAAAAFVREIELTCDGRAWVFAQTLIPPATLARHRWLSALGRAALGERLAAVPGLERGPTRVRTASAGRSPLSPRTARTARPACRPLGAAFLVCDRGRPPAGAGSVPARGSFVSRTDPDYKPEWQPHPLRDAFARSGGRSISTRFSCACTSRSASGCSCWPGALGPVDRGRRAAGPEASHHSSSWASS